jgi:hypothetical protein
VAYHLTRVFNNDDQDVECTAAKFYRLVGFLQHALGGIQSKRPKGNDLLGVLAACFGRLSRSKPEWLHILRRFLTVGSFAVGLDPFGRIVDICHLQSFCVAARLK